MIAEVVTDLAAAAWYVPAGPALQPRDRLHLSEWADRYFRLPPGDANEGPWRTLPYQRDIMDAFSDPAVESVAVMKSTRIGYTNIIKASAGYYIHQDPCPVMMVVPSLDDAERVSKEDIAPMLRDVDVLAALAAAPRAKDSNNTILHKVFANGASLTLVGANSARGFRGPSRKVVNFDEVDGYPPSAGPEGDQIKLGLRRTETYWDRKIGYGSTPTIAGRSRIERLFELGDQRRRYLPCPHCGHLQVLRFAQFRWPNRRPDQAVYVCESCGVEIEHRQKREMDEAGEWWPASRFETGVHPHFPDVPAPPSFRGHVSFHIWAAYSYSAQVTWGKLCTEFLEAKDKPEELKTFVNTVLGETWREKGEAPEWERLSARRETYAVGSCPAGVLFLTASCDVQKASIRYEVVGWGRGKENWSIDADIIPGDTADLGPNGPWVQVDALLARGFALPNGVVLHISLMAIDSGYNTQVVYEYVRHKPANRVIAVKGDNTRSGRVLVSPPKPVDVTFAGKFIARGCTVRMVSGDLAKSEFYGWLKLAGPSADERAAGSTFPPGFCHFPEYGDEYFKQITAEQLVAHVKRNGFTEYTWEQLPNRENHWLDCRQYARAAAAVVGIDRFKDEDWQLLERAVGYDQLGLPLAKTAPLPGGSQAPARGVVRSKYLGGGS